MKWKLDIPEGFAALTDAEKAVICNGAGAADGIKVPNTMYGLDMKIAFDIHDYDYWRGRTLKDKREADERMRRNMSAIINNRGGWLTWLRRYRATTYYSAVVDYGHNAFWEGKEKPR